MKMPAQKPISLSPLKFKDAVVSLLQVKPPNAKAKAKRPKRRRTPIKTKTRKMAGLEK